MGGRDDILSAVEKYKIDLILFAIPTASARDKRDILNICKETKCELKSLPGVYPAYQRPGILKQNEGCSGRRPSWKRADQN